MPEKKTKPEIRFKGFINAWNKLKFDELADYKKGPFGSALTKDIFIPKSKDTVKVYEQQNAINKNWKLERYFIPKAYALKMNSFEVNAGDIIVSCAGTIGEIYIIPNDAESGIINQALMRIRVKENIINKNLFTFLFSSMIDQFSKVHSNGSAMKNIPPFADLKPTQANIPIKAEQEQITAFLVTFDNLIILKQRKYDKLKNVKKAMLEKMFPTDGTDVPEIRFKGFSEPWRNKSYRDSFVNLPNNTFSRAELNYDSGLSKNIHYGDVLIKFGEILDVEEAEIPYVTDDSLVSNFNLSRLQNGDVIIADAAEDETVGKCTELVNVGEQIIVSGLHTIPIRPISLFATGYLGYFMNSPAYHNQLIRLMQGTKVLSISKTAIQDTAIIYPIDIEEQTKISNYFQSLDNLINLHQRELEKLKNIKRACLEKMFV